MVDVQRIDPSEAVARIRSGALLVCAYEDEAMFRKNHLHGALSLQEFTARHACGEPEREIIFYCN